VKESSSTSDLIIVASEYPPFPGGISSYAYNLALEASAFRRVTVIAPGDAEQADGKFTVKPCLEHHRLTLLSLVRSLAIIGRMNRRALIHAADIRAGLIGLCARVLLGRRYMVMTHGSDVAKFDHFSLSKLAAMAVYGMASRVVSNSNYTKGIYEKNFPHGSRCVSIPLGVGEDWFSVSGGGFSNPLLSSIREGAEIFCTVGRLEPRKGHLIAVEALAEYQRLNPQKKVVYVIGGLTIDAEYQADIQREVERHGLDVRFTGPVSVSDLKKLYRRATAQLLCAISLPGKIEGFGLVLLEAAAQGCPSIVTNVGGVPEVVLDGETGVIVKEASVASLLNAISQLDEMIAAGGVGENCIRRARGFSWSETAKRTYLEA